jgi:hypothetical protein
MLWIKGYPYLFANILSLMLFLALGTALLKKEHRNIMVLGGLLNATSFGFLVYLEGVYWSPLRIGGGILGIEDVLCSFDVAAMAWFIVSLIMCRRIEYGFRWEIFLKRFFFLSGLAVSFFLFFCGVGVSGMTSLLCTCVAASLVMLLLKRSLWPLAAVGLFSFTLLYLFVVKIYFLMWPDFVEQWSPAPPWGTRFWGIPLGEISWAAVFGAYWPLFTGHIFNIALKKTKAHGI